MEPLGSETNEDVELVDGREIGVFETEIGALSGSESAQEEELEGWDSRDKEDYPVAPPPSPADNASSSRRRFEEFFKIRPSPLGGLGAFAARDLKKGETILVEKPLLWTTHFGLMSDFRQLTASAKAAYLNLHGGSGDPFSRIERIKTLNS